MHFQVRELTKNLEAFRLLFDDVDPEFVRWKKDAESWCYLEVVCHLYDEEKEDFRLRLKSLLNNPKEDFVPIDPVNWVQTRSYITQDYRQKCIDFYSERKDSIAFLNIVDQDDPSWMNSKNHTVLGELNPMFYLNNWLAHDLLHLRQLTKIKYDYINSLSGNNIAYAGSWK